MPGAAARVKRFPSEDVPGPVGLRVAFLRRGRGAGTRP